MLVGAAQVGWGSPSPLRPHPAGSESFSHPFRPPGCGGGWHAPVCRTLLIARAAGLEPTSLLSCTAPSVNDEKRKGWELLSLSLAPDSLPYIIQ